MAESVEYKSADLKVLISQDRLTQAAVSARRLTHARAALILEGPSLTRTLAVSGPLAGLDLPDRLIGALFDRLTVAPPQAIDTTTKRNHDDGSAANFDGGPALAGVLILTELGQCVGALCVVDDEARHWSDSDLVELGDVARSLAADIGRAQRGVSAKSLAGNSTQASALRLDNPAETKLAGSSVAFRADVRTSSEDLKFQPSTARVLVVDDLDLNRRLIADMLSLEGYEVDCANDGADAVQAVQSCRYDLILMDMIMPGMDGLEATRTIRALPAPTCNVAIVALTAHAFQEQLDSCLAAGMDATITKPMSMDALMTTVRAWTSERSQAA